MPIAAGELDKYVRIDEFAPDAQGASTFGKALGTWQMLFECFAKLSIDNASEQVAQSAKTSVRTATIIIRRRDAITEKLRVVWKGRTFHVTGVTDDGGDFLTLAATEQIK